MSQRGQWEQEISALRMKLQQAHDRDTPGDPEINVPVPFEPTIYCSLYYVLCSVVIFCFFMCVNEGTNGAGVGSRAGMCPITSRAQGTETHCEPQENPVLCRSVWVH